MAEPVWGQLEKSQVDNEKIEEAAARLIQAHKDDANAHIEAGQSLKTHKEQETIDHLDGSVKEQVIGSGAVTSAKITTNQIIGKDFRTDTDVGVGQDGVKFDADGIEMYQGGVRKVNIPKTGDAEFRGDVIVDIIEYTKFLFRSFFESLDGWTQYKTDGRGSIVVGICNLIFNCGNQIGDRVEIATPIDNKTINLSTDDPIIDVKANVNEKTEMDFNVSVGVSINGVGAHGFGFRWSDTDSKLYAFHKKSGTEYKTEITGVDVAAWHRYRAAKTSAAIKYYVDGVLKHTATANLPTEPIDFIILLGYKATTTGEPQAIAESLLYIQNT